MGDYEGQTMKEDMGDDIKFMQRGIKGE